MFLHRPPPPLWRRRGSSRTRTSWPHPYTAASAPAERSSVPAHMVGSGEPGAGGLSRGPRLLPPTPQTRHRERRESTSLSNLMRWENTSEGFYTYMWPWSHHLHPCKQPIDEGRGVRLGGFSLNTQLIIPSSYLHTINGAILYWNNSSLWRRDLFVFGVTWPVGEVIQCTAVIRKWPISSRTKTSAG